MAGLQSTLGKETAGRTGDLGTDSHGYHKAFISYKGYQRHKEWESSHLFFWIGSLCRYLNFALFLTSWEKMVRAQRWWSETKKLLIIKTNKKLCFIDIAEPPLPHAPGKCGLTSPHPTPLFCPDMIRVQADELNAERYVHTKTCA